MSPAKKSRPQPMDRNSWSDAIVIAPRSDALGTRPVRIMGCYSTRLKNGESRVLILSSGYQSGSSISCRSAKSLPTTPLQHQIASPPGSRVVLRPEARRFGVRVACYRFGIPLSVVILSSLKSSAIGSHATAFSLPKSASGTRSPRSRFRGEGGGMAARTPRGFAKISLEASRRFEAEPSPPQVPISIWKGECG